MSAFIRQNVSLKPFNTFALDVNARLFAEVATDNQLHEAITQADARSLPLMMLGGGSNVVLTRDMDALVVHMVSQGVRILQDDGRQVLIEAEAGVRWHDLVLWSLDQGLAGLENLSLIPGTVGAAPIQNIGAYGVELKDVFAELTAMDRQTGTIRTFSAQACDFAYRDSHFKRVPGRWLIVRVRLQLSRRPRLNLAYGAIEERLQQAGITSPTPIDVSRIICSIRREKLPDPGDLGNAGSIFKNPSVCAAQAEALRALYPQMPVYPQQGAKVKLAAGWLIDQAGWKGVRQGPVGVHERQALVLVNYGGATGAQIVALADRIREDVLRRFAIELEVEPAIY